VITEKWSFAGRAGSEADSLFFFLLFSFLLVSNFVILVFENPRDPSIGVRIDPARNFVESSSFHLFPHAFDSFQRIIASPYVQVQVHCSIWRYSHERDSTIRTVCSDEVDRALKSISNSLS
jgi:hypothetical protein